MKPSGRRSVSPYLPEKRRESISLESLLGKYAAQESLPTFPCSPEDEALLQYTGAISDGIKGVVLTHRNLVANTLQIRQLGGPGPEGKGSFPLGPSFLPCLRDGRGHERAHLSGLDHGHSAPLRGQEHPAGHQTLPARLSSPGSPPCSWPFPRRRTRRRYNISCLRVCYSGAAPLSLEILEDFEKLTGARVTEGYGLAETSPATHCNPIFGKRKPGSVGLPYPDTLARIVDLESGEQSPPAGRGGRTLHSGAPRS